MIDNATGGPARRLIEDYRKQQKLLDAAVGGSARRFFEEEQERQKLFDRSGIGTAVQELLGTGRRNGLLSSYQTDVVRQYVDAEEARRKAFDVTSLASAQAFQDNISSTISKLVGASTGLSKRMRDMGILDRVAEQQYALIKATQGISSYADDVIRGIGDALPAGGALSATFGVQSALAKHMRKMAETTASLDQIALSGGIRDSTIWESMRTAYGLNDAMSVSQAFLEIGTQLDQPGADSKALGVYEAWQLIQFLWMVFTMYAMLAGWGDYTADDRKRGNETAEAVERIEVRQQMQEMEAAIAEASALSELKRIEELPKAFVRNAANVREAPGQEAERIARLGQNAMLAIEERKGRWLRVIYADPLTQELPEGWVWRGSVELLSEDRDS
ncbi:SH3 domain-containing protein [Pacificimonas sp. WHA3]|uniref:SH3 domain-containing protein n=1 Tax=Pacificimonas pallii TaxID=2827236 RepID=A0ABS6SCY3_9SPHN|nr:SH3 domain-containing protein [Pacificimonas pallii]MBV7256273.1 SH3 domain-containing protein [Pacificimonas pallii]